ncbi:O-antigen ligase family protein [Suttonella ornithocola]|uniref:Lipid A core - O-antigen ligase and related enzymes n=1 Tax=Suttonella ornithocola TaxID=279832 RepID=A0A380MXU0_9GAMM|nr:O-antigen ligase family protein [Suttonella ornithocola]SUO97102.1 Lipid A core - O-antigen ligase and related enzymes [Suttonella ornithocola]
MNRIKKYGIFFNSIGWICLFSACFILKSGYGIGAGLLLLTGIASLWLEKKAEPLSYSARRWIAVLLIFSSAMIAVRLVIHQPLKEYDELSRYLLSIIIVIGLSRWRFSQTVYLSGIVLGCISAFLVVFYPRFWLNLPSANDYGYQHHIQFSNIAMIMAILSGFATLAYTKYSRLWWIALGGALCGIGAAFLAGGRGSWIMLPVMLALYSIAVETNHRWRTIFVIFLTVCLVVIVFYLIPQTGVAARIQGVFHDLTHYQQGHIATSQGQRLEMWRCGLVEMWPHRPWLGWGDPGLLNEKIRLSQIGTCDSSVGLFAHLHNDFIDTLVRYGLVGFIILVVFYLYPLVHYICKLRYCYLNSIQRMAAWTGIAITLAFMIGSMTNAFLGHNIATTFYIILQAWCMTEIGKKTIKAAGLCLI